MIMTACQGGFDIDDNGGNKTEQPDSGGSNNGDNGEDNNGGENSPKIELSQQVMNVGFEQHSYSISVTSPYQWNAVSENNDWLIVESATGIAGTEPLSFRVERNTVEKERKGTILIANYSYDIFTELHVIQNAFEPNLTVEHTTLSFTAEGDSQTIAVTSNFDYEVTPNVGWITCEKGTDAIVIEVSSNYGNNIRTAEITIGNSEYSAYNKIIYIEQAASTKRVPMEFKGYLGTGTRSTTDDNSVDSFNVWGVVNDGNSITNIFNYISIEKSGDTWTYSPIHYWEANKKYNFAAIANAGTATINTDSNGIPISIDYNIANQQDLLYAKRNATTPSIESLGQYGMEPVSFEFEHLLSKVRFHFTNGFQTDNITINVSNIQIRVPEKATIALDTKTWSNHSGEDYLTFGNITNLASKHTAATASGFTIPTYASQTYEVKFYVQVYYGGVEAMNEHITLDFINISFEAGYTYGIEFFIDPEIFDGGIRFSYGIVSNWSEQDNSTTI